MPLPFERPVGASADVAELEFISALHQTDLHPRKDASIKAIDVVHFLSSRYGIRVTVEEVEETILRGLGGEDDAECIDLVEMVSILIIPELIKASRLLLDGPILERDREEFDHEWEYDEYCRRFSILKSHKPDPRMIEAVLGMILKDATGSDLPKRLDRQLVKDIFASYGEHSLVENDTVIDEMIMAATAGNEEGEGTFLDARAFARALTFDVQKYDVNNETKLSTHYHDVFDTYKSTKEIPHWSDHLWAFTQHTGDTSSKNKGESDDPDEECTVEKSNDDEVRPVERFFTFPAIDYVAGTYSSKVYVVILWVCGVVTYFAYLYDFEAALGRFNCTLEWDENLNVTNRGQYFGCRIANALFNWIFIMLELSILGSIFICFGSVGNSVFNSSPLLIVTGMGFVALFTIIPFAVEVETPFFHTFHSAEAQEQFMYYMSLVLGCVLMIMQAKYLVQIVVPEEALKRHRRLAWFFIPNIVVAESNIKQAASFKMSRLLRNALDIHRLPSKSESPTSHITDLSETSYGRALLNFNSHGENFETFGGVKWAWQAYLSGSLQREEGIFLNSQIVAGNVSQIIVCIFVLIATIVLAVAEAGREPSNDPSFEEWEGTPKRWMAVLSILVGLMFGLIAAITIVVKYIPSATTTIMQYRSGVLKTLSDNNFWIYRVAEDQISLLFGSIFWGAFYTTFAIGVFFGLLTFVAVWQVTRDLFLHFFANILGLLITLLIKVLILRCLRKSYYAGFYRKQPMKANILNVVLQSWNVALATGYMLARGLFLLLATMLFIGRIDKPFLAPDIASVWGLHMDAYPVAFRKALLLNEAHRHPYIERLGFMYMYKLRYGEGFAKTSGSVWRLLFAFALFPWLRKYRIQARPELKDAEDRDSSDEWKFGSYRVLPKPPPRYGSVVGGGTSSGGSPDARENEERDSLPAVATPSVSEEEASEKTDEATADVDQDSSGADICALKRELEELKERNKELMEKVALMEQEKSS